MGKIVCFRNLKWKKAGAPRHTKEEMFTLPTRTTHQPVPHSKTLYFRNQLTRA